MRRYVLAFSLVGVMFAALAHNAAADLLAEVSFNGGGFVSICTAPSGTFCSGNASGGGLLLTMTGAQSNSPGTPILADLLSATLSLTNTNASGTATAHLLIGDTGFRAPTGSVTLLSHIGGSVAVGIRSTPWLFSAASIRAMGRTSPRARLTPRLCLP